MQRLKGFFRKVIELFAKWEVDFDKVCANLKKDGVEVENLFNM